MYVCYIDEYLVCSVTSNLSRRALSVMLLLELLNVREADSRNSSTANL